MVCSGCESVGDDKGEAAGRLETEERGNLS